MTPDRLDSLVEAAVIEIRTLGRDPDRVIRDSIGAALQEERDELIRHAEVFSDANGWDGATARAIISFVQSRTHK